MATPGPSSEITLEETLGVFAGDEKQCEPLTSSEVADELGCTRRTAYRKLDALTERGDVETKKVGAHSRIWWRPAERDDADGPAEAADPAGADDTAAENETRDSGGDEAVAVEGAGIESAQFGEFVDEVEDYAIFALDPDGRVASWNAGAERIKGYDSREILGEHVSTFYTEEDVEAGVPEANLETAATEGRVEDEGWRVREDGSHFWANVVITAIRDDDGGLRGFTKVTRDMTDRREHERRLRRQLDFSERVLEAVPQSVLVFDRDGTVVRTNERARNRLGFDDSEEPGVGERDVYDENGNLIPTDERPYVRAFETGETVTDWEGQIDLPNGRAWMSLTVVPLGSVDPPERVLVVANDITERKERTRQLERRRDDLETELDGVFDRVTDAFFALDEEWRFTYVNEHAASVLDRSAPELVGGNVWDEFPEADAFRREYERAMETQESVSFEEYYPPLDIWFEVTAYPSETGLSVYFRDVTERRERERELERYEAIVETVQDGVYTVDTDGRFTMVNEAYAEMTGYSREELLGSRVTQVVDEETVQSARDVERQLASGGDQTSKIEADVVRADGDTIRAEATFALLPGGRDDYERVGVVRDVSERVERKRALEESERRYRSIVENFPNGSLAMYDADLRYTVIGGEIYDEVDASSEDVEGTPIEARLGEDLFERMEPMLRGAFDGETAEFEASLRGRTFRIRTLPVRDEAGEVFAGMVISQDVTERKERERELQRYETVVETVQDGLYALDADGDFVLANEAFCELTGWDREDLVGRHATTVHNEDIASQARELMADVQAGDEGAATLEFEIRTKGGGRVPIESRFQPLPMEEGEGRCGVVRDVTERKRYEQRLRTLNDTAQLFLRAQSEADVTETVLDAATEILDFPGVGLYRYDADADELYPAASSTDGGFMRRELPRVPADDSTLTGHVYTEGEPRRYDNILETTHNEASTDETEMRAGIFVPMGDHGVLICGAREVGAFDESIQRLVELLAANAEAAYDSIARERELVEYKRIVETVGDGVYVLDDEARFQRVNDAFASMTRFDRDELLGAHASMVFGENFVNLDAEAREQFDVGGLDVAVFEEEINTASEDSITVESRFKEFDVGSGRGRVGVVRDITDRKEYERLLEERSARQESLAELGRYALDDPDIDDLFARATRLVAETLDNDYCKVLDFEPETARLHLREGVGWRDGLVGEASVSAVEDDSQASYTLQSEKPIVVEDLESETRFSGPELLTSHDVSSGISTIIGTADDPWGILGTHDTDPRSITAEDVAFVQTVANVLAAAVERRNYQDELEELVDELRESNERLEQFAYVASHDLQEPLRMVTNYLRLVEDRYGDELDEDGTDFIEYAVDGAERMRRMINGLLTYSRVDTRGDPLEPVDTEAVVDDVLTGLQVEIEDSDAEVEVGSLPTVSADRNQLEQVFQNLVSNALKYTEGGSPRVEIDAEKRGGEWAFRVADDGIGIDPEWQDRIFEVFERLHSREEYDGTGIGLSVCQKIVERHGGDMWVESEPGDGSTFWFTIPDTEGTDE